MTIERSRPAPARRALSGGVRSGVAALAFLAFLASPAALAAEPPYGAGPDGGAVAARAYGSTEIGGSRRLDLSIGRSVIIDLPRDAKEVFVANPAVANAVVRSTRKIFLIGMANGATSVFVMDAEGRQIASFEVNVGRDLNILRQALRTAVPNGRIEVKPAGDSILLLGQVASAGDAQQAVDIARAFVGQAGAAGGASGGAAVGGTGGAVTGAVINALTINGRDQVMIKVTVVEMARTALKQLGINVSGNWNLIQLAAGAYSPGVTSVANAITGVAGTLGAAGGTIGGTAALGNGNSSIGGTLSALEQAGLSRTLAEPTLVAISGESANFLAGGELPIPSTPTCTATATGGAQSCSPTIQFKNVGVQLAFMPIVLDQGRISLRVSTEVTEVDRSNSITIFGTSVPGFRTRKTATTIELPSGATMVTAGLISSQSTQTISGVPGLINLPILGALFRSRDFQRNDTELMIMVTPFIAKPMESAQAVRPDDGFVEASDPQTVLLGRLNKLYGVAGPGPARGYSGPFGFITD